MRTYPIGQNSPDKRTWWKVDLGGLYSIHSMNIQFKIYKGYGKRISVLRQLLGKFFAYSVILSMCHCISISTFLKLFSINYETYYYAVNFMHVHVSARYYSSLLKNPLPLPFILWDIRKLKLQICCIVKWTGHLKLSI